MIFTYENQGTNTYLVYQVQQEDEVDSMSLGMLTNNKIAGLAPVLVHQLDNDRFIKYNVSAKVSVKQFFAGPVNRKRLVGVFCGILDAMLSAEEYMIDSHSILLDLDYIYADVSTCETVLICLPIVQELQMDVDLKMLFQQIVFSTRFDQTENCDYVAQIINYLNSSIVFSLEEFREVLHKIDETGSDKAGGMQQTTVQQTPPLYQSAMPDKGNYQAKQEVRQPSAQPPQGAASLVQPSLGAVNPVQPSVQQPRRMMGQPAVTPPQQHTAVSAPNKKKKQTQNSSGNEKQISMFYLLQHYNKENKELYKAQKEAKKAGGKNTKAPQQTSNMGFAVPGQPANAVPSQRIPQPTTPQGKAPSAPAQARQAAIPQQQVQPVSQSAVLPQAAPVPQISTAADFSGVKEKPMNFGETTVLNGPRKGETTVLNMAQAQVQNKPHLVRLKNNEKIDLNKPVFRIGKEKSYVDYFVSDNTAISRSHANFITRDGEYFVMDTNSTNHTYVNGAMIQSNMETKIAHGSTIRLANEDFEFRLY